MKIKPFLKTHLWQISIITLVISLGAGWYYHTRIQGAATIATDTSNAQADFEADLTSTLDLQRGTGGPTFTRADGADRRATVTDFEGLIRPVKAGEARFQGARRVENLVTYNSEDLTGSNSIAFSSGTGVVPTRTFVSGGGPVTTMGATRLQMSPGSSGYSGITVATGATAGSTGVKSVWMKTYDGSAKTVIFRDTSGSTSDTVSVSGTWQRFSILKSITASGLQIWVTQSQNSGADVDVLVSGIQFENVTGQANQNPSEYVSVGVRTAAPYHGANVDGVKYFTTENGNTVASNVVTEATGAVIADSTLKGYLAEGSRTNLLTYSEQFDNAAWITTDVTVTADNTTAPDGKTTADLITYGTTSTSDIRQQSITITASASYTASVYVKRGNYDWIRLIFATSGYTNRAQLWANINTGVMGTVNTVGSGTVSGSSIASVGNGWYRISVTGTIPDTSGMISVISANGDGSTARTSNGTHYQWGAQLEQASFASSYIPTTTASVTRAADTLTYPSSGNLSSVGSPETWYAEFYVGGVYPYPVGGANLIGTDSSYRALGLETASGKAYGYYGTAGTKATASQTYSAGSIQRAGKLYTGSLNTIYSNGTSGTSVATTLPGAPTKINIGYDGGGTAAERPNGTVRNVKIWKQAMSDTFLTNLTAGNTGTEKKTTIDTGSGGSRADLQADLTSTLDLQRGTGGPTFTRADGADRRATVTDFEGLIRPVKAGEARFQGARRVENLLTYSEDMSNASWSKTGTGTGLTAVVTANYGVAPDGTQTADRVQLDLGGGTAGTDLSRIYKAVTTTRGTSSVWLKTTDGSTKVIRFYFDSVGTQAVNISVTGTWQRFAGLASANTGYLQIVAKGDVSSQTTDLLVWGAQTEETAGQANQNPSEYVSTGVKTAAPYHGANVDGVKYFTTQNGNTVASNIVTEATGSAIADSTLKGYLAEGSRTNLFTYSEQFDNAAWTKVDTTVSANAVAAPDGKNTADMITQGGSGTESFGQYGIPISANSTLSGSIYIKKGTGNFLYFSVRDAVITPTNRIEMWADLTNGTIGTVSNLGTASGASGSISSVGNGFYRVSLSGAVNNSATSVNTYNYLVGSNGSYSRTGGATAYLWGGQFEQASFASSYIPTTSASVTRAVDSLSYLNNSDNFSNATGSAYIEVASEDWSNIYQKYLCVSTANCMLQHYHSSGASSYDGSGQVSGTGTASGTIKAASKWGSSSRRIFINGAAGTAGSYGGSFGSGNLSIGYGDSNRLYGTIRNVKIWKQAMSDTFLTSLTGGNAAVEKKTTINAGQNDQLTSGLVGFWSFNGTDMSGTTAYDRSGQNNNGTLTNGPTRTIGKVGQALSFDGTNDYVETSNTLSSIATGANFTFSVWLKNSSAMSTWGRVVHTGCHAYANGMFIGRYFNTNQVVFAACSSGGAASSFVPVTVSSYLDQGWHHVVVTVDRTGTGTLRMYIDGANVSIGKNAVGECGTISGDTLSMDISSCSAATLQGSGAYLRFGADSSGAERWGGNIDEVRIYNRALPAAEVSQLYNLGR